MVAALHYYQTASQSSMANFSHLARVFIHGSFYVKLRQENSKLVVSKQVNKVNFAKFA